MVQKPTPEYKKPEYLLSGDLPINRTLHEIFKTEVLFLSQMKVFIIKDNDIEHLHNFRVVLRRLSGLLKLFKKYCKKDSYTKASLMIRQLFDSTNKLRDYDIFLQSISVYTQQFPDDKKTFEKIRKKTAGKRRTSFKKFYVFLKNGYFDEIIKELSDNFDDAFFIENSVSASKSLKKVLNSSLKKLSYLTFDKKASSFDDEKLHILRIKLKKIRYLFDIFHSLFKQKRHTRFVRHLKNIQDILGINQDLTFQMSLINAYEKETSCKLEEIKQFIVQQKHENMLEFASRYKKLTKVISANKCDRLLK